MAGECNCPPPGEKVYTKPPCPVHDTPEWLDLLSKTLIPLEPMGPISGGLRPYCNECERHGPTLAICHNAACPHRIIGSC